MEEPPILIDEEMQTGEWRTWRAVDPETDADLRQWILPEAEASIDKMREGGRSAGRRILLCPLTRKGHDLAEVAAGRRSKVEVSGYQVWIIESSHQFDGEPREMRWMVVHYGGRTRRRTARHERNMHEAVKRIRSRRPNAAIRIVTTTPEGERETTAEIGHPNTVRGRSEPTWP